MVQHGGGQPVLRVAVVAVSHYFHWGKPGGGLWLRWGMARPRCSTDDIAQHGYVLTPGRYVGAEEVEDEGEAFDEKMRRLTNELNAQFAESAKLGQTVKQNLASLGYGS